MLDLVQKLRFCAKICPHMERVSVVTSLPCFTLVMNTCAPAKSYCRLMTMGRVWKQQPMRKMRSMMTYSSITKNRNLTHKFWYFGSFEKLLFRFLKLRNSFLLAQGPRRQCQQIFDLKFDLDVLTESGIS